MFVEAINNQHPPHEGTRITLTVELVSPRTKNFVIFSCLKGSTVPQQIALF